MVARAPRYSLPWFVRECSRAVGVGVTGELVRPVSAVFWDLRAAWASGRRVALRLADADQERVEGHVTRVSATDAFVFVGDLLVPGDRIAALRFPSRLGDSDFVDRPGARWAGRRRRELRPGQDELPIDGGS